MTISTEPFNRKIYDLLYQSRQIAAIWAVEDVQIIRPDLTADEAWEVLQAAIHHHDCNIGLQWGVFESVAESLFPERESPD